MYSKIQELEIERGQAQLDLLNQEHTHEPGHAVAADADPAGLASERARLARTMLHAGLERASARVRNLAIADALGRYLIWVDPLDLVVAGSAPGRTSVIAVTPARSGHFPDEESRSFRE
jgi:hypothetical protein